MIKRLHGLRGYMAFAILFLHLTQFGFFDTETLGFLRHAVDVFFCLSGYVLAKNYAWQLPFNKANAVAFLWNRFARIVPLAWLTTVLYFSIFYLAQEILYVDVNHPLDVSLRNFIGNLFFLDSNVPGFTSTGMKWSVSNEMVAYFFIFPLSYIFFKRPKIIAGVLLLLCLAQPLLWAYLEGLGSLFSRCIPAFLIGVLIFLAGVAQLRHFFSVALWSAGLAGFVFLPESMQALVAGVVIWACVGTTGRFTAWVLENKVACFLGDISYSMYLLHGLVVIGVAFIFKQSKTLEAAYWFWVLIPFLISILIGYVSWKNFEMPIRDRLKRYGHSFITSV